MKVEIVGAGPAGPLSRDPAEEGSTAAPTSRVLERNAPDATFGFGVVFSEETLGALRDADPETHLEITDTFARWDRIDIRYRGRELSSRGHSFSAIARKRLLEILQERCRELGVDARVRRRGRRASGGRPRRRRGRREQLRPRSYARLRHEGADRGQQVRLVRHRPRLRRLHVRLPRDRARALQRARVPVRRAHETFIVECPEAVWRARRASTRWTSRRAWRSASSCSRTSCAGRELFSNRSLWLDFPKVTNKTWHDGNVVLLGDAAHTAHFSIGSGTKLAMEDSIALAACARAPCAGTSKRRSSTTSSSARLSSSAPRRRPARAPRTSGGRELLAPRADPVRVQPAHAQRPDHARDPRPCATRSSRARSTRGSAATAPSRRRRRSRRSSCDGVALREPRSTLVPSGFVAGVAQEGRITPGDADDRRVARHAPASCACSSGTRGGAARRQPRERRRRPAARATAGRSSASPIAYGPYGAVRRESGRGRTMACRARRVRRSGARAAAAASTCWSSTWPTATCSASYLSPLTNDEDDRLRFPLEVLEAVRAVWPTASLAVRLSVTDWHPRGNSVDDGHRDRARAAPSTAATSIHVEAGQTIHDDRPRVPARVPDRAQRPRAQRGARADARRRPPDDARRGEHDRRRRPRRPVLLDLPETARSSATRRSRAEHSGRSVRFAA